MVRTALTRSTVAGAVRASAPARRAGVAMAVRSKHTLPDLPYDFGALEPAISAQIMQLHHQKHHNTYVTNLNAAEEAMSDALAKKDVKKAIATQKALNFNGGGHLNHSLFWTNLAPPKQGGGELSAGPLQQQIEKDFGSLDGLKSKMNTALAGIQGSGWGWLGYDKEKGKLDIVTTANQDPLITHIPLIGIDAWEHAYYLQYQNVKADYFKAIWDVINFKEAEKRMTSA
ncbi:putative SOD2-superoxide dismutase precursor, mitochondrial [Tilletiaria anomala UBC 951]|uniref:Superoxide dismutase n=1 Tax=Tilletiaria anomala (strain ATCC 24038 / CBS 436.72 / UBC 951) TaxID=1037660 RepID=A0A066WRK1_TILAU|nr:putative SOD2-superoxide dismutase precursor, mitochondrial [Tilletiaria anomala UBC 951]KDN53629.1 putative SOD2-superoxide dismutase precursor, mitochondrial [Tilletiaria anomala UBC 951]